MSGAKVMPCVGIDEKTGNFELITKISRREAFRKNKKTLRITGGLSKIHTIRTK